jgi:hypothetical protein
MKFENLTIAAKAHRYLEILEGLKKVVSKDENYPGDLTEILSTIERLVKISRLSPDKGNEKNCLEGVLEETQKIWKNAIEKEVARIEKRVAEL